MVAVGPSQRPLPWDRLMSLVVTPARGRPPPCPAPAPGCIIAKVVRAGPSRLCRCLPDVDECAAETPPCGDQQYCENVNGSFVCEGAWAWAPPGRARTSWALGPADSPFSNVHVTFLCSTYFKFFLMFIYF